MNTRVARCIQAALLIVAAEGCSNGAAVGQVQQSLEAQSAPVKLVACGDLLLATDPIKPASELDYIGLYRQFWPSRPDYVAVESDYGEVCRGTQDQQVCVSEVVARLADPPTCTSAELRCKPFVITTHGGDVQRYSNPEQLAGMLGRVDTASEAVLIAQLHGLDVTCTQSNDQPAPGTLVQETASGWRVQSQSDCGGLQTIDIRQDGTSPGLEQSSDGPMRACP